VILTLIASVEVADGQDDAGRYLRGHVFKRHAHAAAGSPSWNWVARPTPARKLVRGSLAYTAPTTMAAANANAARATTDERTRSIILLPPEPGGVQRRSAHPSDGRR
jgi:hypothetical protein